ncbi:MAG: glycosyltransferase family 39 protein [bacterium]|nr:glycosyltransferase family 39 protein [bacterium]
MDGLIQKNKILIIFLFILFLASFFRLWQLDLTPPGLYPDIAINGNDALKSLETGNFKVFYSDNNGREGLFMWLIAISFSIFGISIWSIKIVAAVIGILTVLGLYLLTKELFNNQKSMVSAQFIALLSSFFLAVSFWHVNFSRMGFRAILLPFILVFSFYFLFKGFRLKQFRNFIIAGAFFGLGFYTYTSFRLAVMILPVVLIIWWLIYKKENFQKKYFFFAACFLFSIFIIGLPLGIYFLQTPQDFISRATPISIFSQANPAKAFVVSLIQHLGMFNFYGDPNWRHNFAGSPMLFWPVGILLFCGIIFSIKELIFSVKNKNYSPLFIHGFLLSWFFAMLLPGILTYEGIPHSLRVIGVIPVVYIFSGLGGLKVYQLFKENIKNKNLFLVACLFFLLMIIAAEFDKYFVKWGKNPAVKKAFAIEYAEMGNYLNSLPPEIEKYVIVNELGFPLYGISIPAQTPMFIEATKFGKPNSIYIKAEELDKIKLIKGKTVIISLYDGKIFNQLQEKFPAGIIKTANGFLVFEINQNNDK